MDNQLAIRNKFHLIIATELQCNASRGLPSEFLRSLFFEHSRTRKCEAGRCQMPSGVKARKVLFWAAVGAAICIVAWVVMLSE